MFVMDTIIIRIRATKRLRSYPFCSLMTRLVARLVAVVDQKESGLPAF
jgi:hypothetical protein